MNTAKKDVVMPEKQKPANRKKRLSPFMVSLLQREEYIKQYIDREVHYNDSGVA